MLAPFNDLQEPGPEDVRAELTRMCAAPPLERSPRLASFLRYVVDSTLSGHADRLKGYTIGVEALGRAESFDPQSDPIVRVEAIRLRAAMTRYYAGPGAGDPVVIDMPRGRYVPRFRWARRSLPRIAVRRAHRALKSLRERLLAAWGPRLLPPRRLSLRARRWPRNPKNPAS